MKNPAYYIHLILKIFSVKNMTKKADPFVQRICIWDDILPGFYTKKERTTQLRGLLLFILLL